MARDAAATAAVELLAAGMTIGLGSGRAVWKVVEGIAARWPDGAPLRGAVASDRTDRLARAAGIEVVELDGELVLDLTLDGADEIDGRLRLIKGGGGALLREKILVCASRSFVVVAEDAKRVGRLGERAALPVEVVCFGWQDTRRRLRSLLDEARLRLDDRGQAFVTDEGHHILDCVIPSDADPDDLDATIKCVPGVVEHGLFIAMADRALLGHEHGTVDIVDA